jgi:hypothetical protein
MEDPIVRNVIQGDDKSDRFVDFYESTNKQAVGENKILSIDNFNKRYKDYKNYPIRKGRY